MPSNIETIDLQSQRRRSGEIGIVNIVSMDIDTIHLAYCLAKRFTRIAVRINSNKKTEKEPKKATPNYGQCVYSSNLYTHKHMHAHTPAIIYDRVSFVQYLAAIMPKRLLLLYKQST